MLSQDTAELFFEDCRVPKENLLGPEEGQGFIQLMQKLQQERLVAAIGSVASMWAVLDWTKQYCQERSAFGKPIIKFQNTRFKLVEMYTMAEVCQAFCDRLIKEHVKGTDVVTETSMAKYFFTEESNKIVDQCLQFFGGYGYMDEYPISRAFRDIRVTTIYGGATEIMKEIIGRNLGM
jgi:alkylation response protein AidB-like acyl-CoA dehydrogenase